MPSVLYANALKEFDAALGEIRAYVEFVSASNHLRPRIYPMVDQTVLDNEHRGTLAAFTSHSDYHVETGFNGLVISLAGVFEEFVRRLIRDGVLWINESYGKFEELNEQFRKRNIQQSGYALATVFDPPVETSYDYEELCKNLGTCTLGGGSLVLNAQAFVLNITNVTPARIDDFLKRINVSIDWDMIGKNATLQKLLGETRTRDATKAIKEWLSVFIITRNRLAHSSVGGIQTSEAALVTAIDFFQAFTPALAQVVEDVLKKSHKK